MPAWTISATGHLLQAPAAAPGWLDAAQLASLRATAAASMPFRCDVLANVSTSFDDQGNLIADWQTIAYYNSDIRERQVFGETVGASKLIATGLFDVTLPFDAIVLPEYRLRINNIVYEIENDWQSLTDQAVVHVVVRQSR